VPGRAGKREAALRRDERQQAAPTGGLEGGRRLSRHPRLRAGRVKQWTRSPMRDDDVIKGAPRHVGRSRVAWIDTDAGGRIHFTAAFRWAEAAETALLRSLGLLDGWGDYPRRAVEAEYLAVL